jgi:heat shock protein HslJ
VKVAVRLISLLLIVAGAACSNSTGDDAGVGSGDTEPVASVVGSIEGRWILESWQEGEESGQEGEARIPVETGVNSVSEPWLEFTLTSETTGTFVGWTGCNGIRGTDYEFSAGFLVVEEAVVQAVGCEPNRAEEVLLAMLWNTPDGIEVVMGVDRMELFGSNLYGTVYPLMFRRDG